MAKNVTKRRTAKKKARRKATANRAGASAKYPRHSLAKALRIPKAILEQNAGQSCSDRDAASYAGLGLNGPTRTEISSSLKFGFLERPQKGSVAISDLAKKILRPQAESEEIEGKREALLVAPEFSNVYKHYRGENLPDATFLKNKLNDSFNVPPEKLDEFIELFLESLRDADLIEEHGDKKRIIDFATASGESPAAESSIKQLGKQVKLEEGDTCFVVMPFADPLDGYYKSVYEPAIEKAGLKAIRADADIFGAGKIIDQIWMGIRSAKVLVAELTQRNPNVFYELGLAHALKKPVVLVSSNESDVPFDLQHVRVIYYDCTDPFWGKKLIDKVAENILSAIKNPAETVLFDE